MNPHIARAAGSGYGVPQHAPPQHAAPAPQPAPQGGYGAAPAQAGGYGGAQGQVQANPHVIARGYGGAGGGGNPFVQSGYGDLGAYQHQDDPPQPGRPSPAQQQHASMAAAYGDPGEVGMPGEETTLQWLVDAHEGYEALGADFGSFAAQRPLTLFVAPRSAELRTTSALQSHLDQQAQAGAQAASKTFIDGGPSPAPFGSVQVEPMPKVGGTSWFRVSAMGYEDPFRRALEKIGKVKTPDQVHIEADPPKRSRSWLWWGLGAIALIGIGAAAAVFLL